MENTPNSNLAAEVKENAFYNFAKNVVGKMGEIGAGALAGAATAMIPTDKMNPIQKFCIGFGSYSIAKWVSKSSKQALKDDLDEIVDAICNNMGSIKKVVSAIDEAQKEVNGETKEPTEEE